MSTHAPEGQKVNITPRQQVERYISDLGLSVEQATVWLLLAIHAQLSELDTQDNPDLELTKHDSVNLNSSGAGTVTFKNGGQNETWKISSIGYDSQGGHTVTVKCYSDPSSTTPLNLVANDSGNATNVTWSGSPISVLPGHFLVVVFSAGTSADTLAVTIQGWRELRDRPHGISRPRAKKR